MPFFSIIIPTYNRAHLITKTIKSVINQTHADWECIIVDDGSTDNTKEVIDAIADSRIRYIYQTNAERSVARNNGIANAQGEYICFLDSDDLYEPHHLQTLKDFLHTKQNQAVCMTIVHAAIERASGIEYPQFKIIQSNPLNDIFTNAIIPAQVCIHKSILAHIKFESDIICGEDLIVWTRIATQFPIFEIPLHTIRYILHDDNSVNLKNNSYYIRLLGLRKFFKRYPEVTSRIRKSVKNQVVSDTLFGVAKHNIFVQNSTKAFIYTSKAIIAKPNHLMTKHRFLVLLALLNIYPRKVISQYQN